MITTFFSGHYSNFVTAFLVHRLTSSPMPMSAFCAPPALSSKCRLDLLLFFLKLSPLPCLYFLAKHCPVGI